MAFGPNELFSANDMAPFANLIPRTVLPKTFLPDAGKLLLAVGYPVCYDSATKKWTSWKHSAGGDRVAIKGIVFPDPIQLDAVFDVLGQVLVEGKSDYASILAAAIPASGEAEADLKTDLQSDELRELGIYITNGLAGVD